MNMGSPNITTRPIVDEGGGYARSTDDTQDNITWEEGRGITVRTGFRNRNL
jgi:hypothetical protein